MSNSEEERAAGKTRVQAIILSLGLGGLSLSILVIGMAGVMTGVQDQNLKTVAVGLLIAISQTPITLYAMGAYQEAMADA